MQTFPVTEACRLSIGALAASAIFLAKQSTQIQRRCRPSWLVLTDRHFINNKPIVALRNSPPHTKKPSPRPQLRRAWPIYRAKCAVHKKD
jgi:hypothetical protein